MEGFLRRVGVFERVQAGWQEKHGEVEGYSIVNQAFAQPIEGDLTEKVESLYTFRVPKLVEGACSKATVLEEKPFNITSVTDLPYDVEILKNHPFTKRLHALNVIVKQLQGEIGMDWLGIYRRVTVDGKEYLAKEAYVGSESRALFPLTEEFATQSSNSLVGLRGEAKVIENTETHAGPYYECNSLVLSEYCCPIFSKKTGAVIGIIDAEAHAVNFFGPKQILAVSKVCHDLGEIELGVA